MSPISGASDMQLACALAATGSIDRISICLMVGMLVFMVSISESLSRDIELAVHDLHNRIRQAIPVTRLAEEPAPGTLVEVDAMIRASQPA